MEDLPINLNLGYGSLVSSPNEPQYPVLHDHGPEELELPQDGEMTVKFHVRRETSEVDRKTGKHNYECDIEILSIEKVKGEEVTAPARSGNEAESALDRLRDEMESDNAEKSEY